MGGLSAIHVPYAYGFAIILLTVIVKVTTYPLTKQQVESTLAMQNLQPKIKAIQERYAGNQHLQNLCADRFAAGKRLNGADRFATGTSVAAELLALIPNLLATVQ